ncbi:Mediator of RNA polymerase II transcription subunit 7 [Spiromyces aspiralis]|uniref:Mediator of RNA polymerase II transcription subunit 7 n=1 Tax=Spiromyces aspiralis TaxID=68401 RepID=A0ACC1HHF8_9FUNG|nr:Mediator of RNA polymerase II transcription subunit 7 [Spiromyces aspiralis]
MDAVGHSGPGQQQNASAFPLPPEHFAYFTSKNLERARSLSEEQAREDKELGYLFPPPVIKDNEFMLFGRVWLTRERFPSLEDQGIEQLYSNVEPGKYDRTSGEGCANKHD